MEKSEEVLKLLDAIHTRLGWIAFWLFLIVLWCRSECSFILIY